MSIGAIALVTGEIGSGKSTALRYVTGMLHPSEYRSLYFVATAGPISELYRQLLHALPKEEIAGNGYDLSINRYKEVVYEEMAYDPPKKILAELKALEAEIQKGLVELEGMLK
jgi:ABC-type Na+ transport system ATPase subunit NatA